MVFNNPSSLLFNDIDILLRNLHRELFSIDESMADNKILNELWNKITMPLLRMRVDINE